MSSVEARINVAGRFFEISVDVLCDFFERLLDVLHMVFPTGLEVFSSTLEFSQAFAERFSELRKLPGSENQKRDKKDNEKFLKP